jgi:mannose-1-phosphate guanylyltransferase
MALFKTDQRGHVDRGSCPNQLQPENRGTATAIFLALSYIRKRNREATVLIFPSDHFVYPEERFLEIVRAAVRTAQATRHSVVLLGVPAKRPETDYGWIQPGTSFTGANGYRLHIASRFIEKPTPEVCKRAMASGALFGIR